MQNVKTDIKAWKVAHQPRRKHKGFRVACHAGERAPVEDAHSLPAARACAWLLPAGLDIAAAYPLCGMPAPALPLPSQLRAPGFYAAWLSGGFNLRVMDRLREVQAATEGPLRFWVTGALIAPVDGPCCCLLSAC